MADDHTIFEESKALVRELVASGTVIATAESCTGGWISKAITDIAGSSDIFGYGIVSYSNHAKAKMLGVSRETLDKDGAVSRAVVIEMAEGALERSGADIAVAVSGVAGPTGGTPEKPVGTVWFAWGVRDGDEVRTESEVEQFTGDRDRIRELTVLHALRGIRERIQ